MAINFKNVGSGSGYSDQNRIRHFSNIGSAEFFWKTESGLDQSTRICNTADGSGSLWIYPDPDPCEHIWIRPAAWYKETITMRPRETKTNQQCQLYTPTINHFYYMGKKKNAQCFIENVLFCIRKKEKLIAII